MSDDSDMKFGYIEPGKQGIRGKVRWIFTADDLKDMYTVYEQKAQTEVLCTFIKTNACGILRGVTCMEL